MVRGERLTRKVWFALVEWFGSPEFETDDEHDMFVEMDWDEEELAVPLSQLEVIDADEGTREAVEDWLYWSKKGYQF
jgi:Calcium binding